MTKMKIKEMNTKVFDLRSRVMKHIYEAKALYPGLPRIEVRIVDDDETCLAFAYLNKKIIRVSQRAVESGDFDLRTIVFHEIVHAVTGFKHNEACPLMRSKHKPLSLAQCEKLFKKYVNKRSMGGI